MVVLGFFSKIVVRKFTKRWVDRLPHDFTVLALHERIELVSLPLYIWLFLAFFQLTITFSLVLFFLLVDEVKVV